MQAAALVTRFGPEPIYGRPLRYSEVHRITFAEQVERAYAAFKAASDEDGELVKWAGKNPQRYDLALWAITQNGRS